MKYAMVTALLSAALALVGTAAAGTPSHPQHAPNTCGVYFMYTC
ncbi:MAG: hypothetical protein QOI27_2679 [Gaiellaceae bacterium]|jgi:hypothetical protein|nr:hypothetical protein [Gaiellaceae bacterium]MDX6471149.1 hypothetical protein [Gaiellaceae bacterium]